MRISILALVLVVATGHAAPPSVVLERAVKLYDKRDFLSAHIELKKVIDKETGDDAANIARAEFFVGKVLFQVGLHAASEDAFLKIQIAGPTHAYYLATLKWFAALSAVLPTDVTSIATYSEKDYSDPSLHGVRDELVYRRGVIALRKTICRRQTTVRERRQARPSVKARLALGLVQLASEDVATLVGFRPARATSRLALVRHHTQKGELEKATAALANIRRGRTRARAEWELSWAQRKLAPSLAKFASTPVEIGGFEPALLHVAITTEYCAKPVPTASVLAGFVLDAPMIDKQLGWLLSEQDNGDFYQQLLKELAKPSATARAAPFIRAVIGSPAVQPRFAYVAELTRELGVLKTLDRAYQTTAAAAEVMQVLTVYQSVGQADAGKLARYHLERMRKDLAELARLATMKLPAGGTAGLVVQCP
jgi:hypothetical protein